MRAPGGRAPVTMAFRIVSTACSRSVGGRFAATPPSPLPVGALWELARCPDPNRCTLAMSTLYHQGSADPDGVAGRVGSRGLRLLGPGLARACPRWCQLSWKGASSGRCCLGRRVPGTAAGTDEIVLVATGPVGRQTGRTLSLT